MYIITSAKKNIRAISGTNNDVEFHNKLFATDDCVITWQDDPTEQEIADAKAQAEIDRIAAEKVRAEEAEKEALIQEKLRSIATEALVTEGKMDISGSVVKVAPTEEISK